MGRDGSPEDDGASQCPGVVEKRLVELDKLALELARIAGVGSSLWGSLFTFLGLFWWWRGVAAFDGPLEFELSLALFTREGWHGGRLHFRC